MKLSELYSEGWSRNHKDHSTKETPEFWDERAKDFSLKSHNENHRKVVAKFLGQFDWSETQNILDIGAGPGTHSVPLAKMGKTVTALDFSKEMLKELTEVAKKEKVKVKTIQGRWLDFDAAEKFDTVLCLNSLGVASCDENQESHLLKTLEKMKEVCLKQLIILIPHADSPLDENMRKIAQLTNLTQERKRIATLYFAMVECGMLPSLKILEKPFTWVFNHIEEGAKTLLAKAGVYDASPEVKAALIEYLTPLVETQKDGKILFTQTVKQALYIQNF